MTKQLQCITGCGRELTSSKYSVCDGCWEMLKPNDICACGVELVTSVERSMESCWLCKREEMNGLAQTDLLKRPKNECTHKGMPMVFKIGKGEVYASGSRNVWDCGKLDLIVSLSGHPMPTFKANQAAEELLRRTSGMRNSFLGLTPPDNFSRLSMSWIDGKAPPFDLSYVKDLVALVEAGTDILIHCVGGHGRTGTMLVAMLCEMTSKPWGNKNVDPIKWIRTNYCKKAVETDKQIDWLKDRYDIVKKTKETGSDAHASPGSWGDYQGDGGL